MGLLTLQVDLLLSPLETAGGLTMASAGHTNGDPSGSCPRSVVHVALAFCWPWSLRLPGGHRPRYTPDSSLGHAWISLIRLGVDGELLQPSLPVNLVGGQGGIDPGLGQEADLHLSLPQ